MSDEAIQAALARTVKYFLNHIDMLPHHYQSLDANRMTVLFFAVSGLDLLDKLDKVDCDAVVNWVYSQQLVPKGAWVVPVVVVIQCGVVLLVVVVVVVVGVLVVV
jgi:hypothetical protein